MEQLTPSINLLDVIRGIGRHKLLVFVLTALGFAAGMGFVSISKPLYSTEAQVLIENLASPFDRVQGPDNQTNPETIDDRAIQSQMSVLRSRDLAVRVVSALNLQERAEFDTLKNHGVGAISQIFITLGFSEDPRLMTPEERSIKRYFKQLTVYQVPLSSVLTVKYSASDPVTAAEVANALVNTYVASTAEVKFKPTARAREWLGSQITDLRAKLAKSEADIETFRAENGLLKGQVSTLSTQELSELNTQITIAEAASTEAEERAREIREILATQGTVDASTDVLNSPNVQRLREQQVTSARKVAELSAIYLPNHPKMMAAQNDLSNIDRQIRSEALKVVEGLQQQAKIAKARQNSLRARLEEIKSNSSTENQSDVKLKAMERDSAADKALLETLLLRYADASARQDLATQPGFARVIQAADVPTSPSFPKTGPTVLLLTLAGLALSLGLSFLMEIISAANQLGQRISAAPVAQNFVAPVPAEPTFAPLQSPVFQRPAFVAPIAEPVLMPAFANFPAGASPQANRDLLMNSYPLDSFGLRAAGNLVAEWILSLKNTAAVRHVAVVSLGGGTSDSALCALVAARAIATRNARVVVVDLDHAGSNLEILFGLPLGPGFVDLLAGTADFTKVITRDPSSTAHLLRFGFDRSQAARTLLNQKTDSVLAALGSIYDVVIVHAGETGNNTSQLVAKCQAIILAAPQQHQATAAKNLQSMVGNNELYAQYVSLQPWSAGSVKHSASA